MELSFLCLTILGYVRLFDIGSISKPLIYIGKTLTGTLSNFQSFLSCKMFCIFFKLFSKFAGSTAVSWVVHCTAEGQRSLLVHTEGRNSQKLWIELNSTGVQFSAKIHTTSPCLCLSKFVWEFDPWRSLDWHAGMTLQFWFYLISANIYALRKEWEQNINIYCPQESNSDGKAKKN